MDIDAALSNEAFDLGYNAFTQGKTSVPCHDTACMKLIKENDGRANLILSRWTEGWHKANHDQPVHRHKRI